MMQVVCSVSNVLWLRVSYFSLWINRNRIKIIIQYYASFSQTSAVCLIDSWNFPLCFHRFSPDQRLSELQLNDEHVLIKQFVWKQPRASRDYMRQQTNSPCLHAKDSCRTVQTWWHGDGGVGRCVTLMCCPRPHCITLVWIWHDTCAVTNLFVRRISISSPSVPLQKQKPEYDCSSHPLHTRWTRRFNHDNKKSAFWEKKEKEKTLLNNANQIPGEGFTEPLTNDQSNYVHYSCRPAILGYSTHFMQPQT